MYMVGSFSIANCYSSVFNPIFFCKFAGGNEYLNDCLSAGQRGLTVEMNKMFIRAHLKIKN